MNPNLPLPNDLDKVIIELDRLVVAKTSKHLNMLQEMIIRGVWMNATYEDIAQPSHWSEAHVKSVGANLWELVSQLLSEHVTKKNFRATMERRYRELLTAQVPCEFTANSDENAITTLLTCEFPDGPVRLTSQLYCDRPPIESRCYEAIVEPGALIRIRAPRHMGKTSLLNRILAQGQQLGYGRVSLNLQLVDADILQNLDRFLQWFCARVTQKLDLPLRLADYWDDIFGSKTSCKDYFESYLLPQCQKPLILALDDVDTLFPYPQTANGFFSLLRSWYEEGKNNALWQRLRLILVHSTDAYIPLNINQSPFNVGLPIKLPEFNTHQVMLLATQHGLGLTSTQVDQLMSVLGGHPYLVRLGLYHLAQTSISLDELISTMLNIDSPFYGYLQQQLALLSGQHDLVAVLNELLADQPTLLKPTELFQLTRMGLIQIQGEQIQIRCELYRQWLKAYL